MTTIQTSEPAIVYAGDSISWRKSLPNFPATDGWALAYKLVSASSIIAINATADGADYVIDVPASTTSGWLAGTYRWVAFVTKASARYTVASGEIVIRPNLAGATDAFDARSDAERALDDLKKALTTWIATSGHVQEYEIAGRRMRYRSMDEIRKAISLLELEIANERKAARLAAGLAVPQRVQIRFER